MEKGRLLSKKISHIMFALFGVLFVFFTKTGKDLSDSGNLQWTAGYIWQTLLMALVLGGILGILVSFAFYGLAARTNPNDAGRKQSGWRSFLSELQPGAVFWGSLLLILLAWLPAYLAYYPGICAYDFPIQLEQIATNAYIDHHPIAHTLLIKGAWVLGQKVLGNVNAGFAVFTALQMIFLAGAMAWGLVTLHRFRVGIGCQIMLLLYCMFYPFHWYMSVSMTKDIIFSGFVLLFMTAMLVDLLEDRDRLRVSGRDVLLAVSCVGIVLFRNNGKYALLVLLVFLCLALWRGKTRRRLWGRLLLCCGTAFVIGNLLLALLFSATVAQQGDKREMLSMPIQQLARAMIYHGGVGVLAEDDGTMEDADKALINDFLLNEAYRYYRPEISDPVKRHTNTYVVRYRSIPFIKTYFHLLGQYPGEFINAALALDAGYVYPGDTSHAYVNEEEGPATEGMPRRAGMKVF